MLADINQPRRPSRGTYTPISWADTRSQHLGYVAGRSRYGLCGWYYGIMSAEAQERFWTSYERGMCEFADWRCPLRQQGAIDG